MWAILPSDEGFERKLGLALGRLGALCPRLFYFKPIDAMHLRRAITLVKIIACVLLSNHAAAQTAKQLNTLEDIFAAVRTCWKAPKISGPADLVVRLSFTRDGKILGKAHITYENKAVSIETRLLYRFAAMEAFKRCTPLPLSLDLGEAIAGKPINFRFRNNAALRTSFSSEDAIVSLNPFAHNGVVELAESKVTKNEIWCGVECSVGRRRCGPYG